MHIILTRLCSEGEKPSDGDDLKRALLDLITWSGQGLEKGDKIVRTDSRLVSLLPFHEELVFGYRDMLEGMKPFLE